MRKIRVAVLIDAWFPFYGGGQVHVRELTKQLAGECDFKIYHASSDCILNRALWSISVIPKVILEHKKRPFDLIHSHAYIAGLSGKILSLILNIPVIYTVHGSHSLDLYNNQRLRKLSKVSYLKYLLEKWLLTGIRYNREISVTESFLQYPNINKKISVIPNGVNLEPFDSLKEKKKKKFTLVFVGRDDPIKGIQYLEKAVKIVKQKHNNIRLIKISGGQATGEKLIRLYKSSQVFVLPSLAEGQPISLLEAWAAKLPVIVTAVGDNPKMVKNGVNGYLLPPADEKALARAIISAQKNPQLAGMGEAGYNLVKKQYSWQKAAKATLKVYRKVTNGA